MKWKFIWKHHTYLNVHVCMCADFICFDRCTKSRYRENINLEISWLKKKGEIMTTPIQRRKGYNISFKGNENAEMFD